MFDEDWYHRYIQAHCQPEEHDVEIFGRQTRRTVFVSTDDTDVGFTFTESADSLSIFEIQPSFAHFISEHVSRYASSETFYESYKLLVKSQSLPTPVYQLRRSQGETTGRPETGRPEKVSDDIVLQSRYSLVVGGPGSGKTTYIRSLAQQMLERGVKARGHLAPILISLRRFEYDEFSLHSLQHYLRANESDDVAASITENLELGLFKFFLDGLDEVNLERRDKIYEDIVAFIGVYSNNSYTITTREFSVKQVPNHVDVFRLGDWDDFLVRRWCYENLGRHSEWKQFYSNIIQTNNSRGVFRNPLMLSLAGYLFEQYGMLPHRRVDLLFNVVNAIVDEWDKARGIRRSTGLWKSPRQKLKTLSYIAFRQIASKQEVLSEEILQHWIGERIAAPFPDMCRTLAVETGLLAESGPDQWTFVHRTIQEYLAALFIADSSMRPLELLKGIDPSQRSAILAYVSNMVSDSGEFLKSILDEESFSATEKGEILLGAIADGMELDGRNRNRAYAIIGKYLRTKLARLGKVDVSERRMTISQESSEEIVDTLYLIARTGRTIFSSELNDISKAVLSSSLYSVIGFILRSTAFFITSSKGKKEVEAIDESGVGFIEKR